MAAEQVLEEGEEIAAEAPPAKKGLSKKLLMIIIAAVLVLGGGGAAAFFLMKPKADAKVETPEKGGKAVKGEKSEKAHEVKGPAVYIPMDPPFVVNFENEGAMRFLQVSVQVLTRDTTTVDLLKLHEPVIRNDLLLLLGNQKYETLSSREGKEQLRQQALEAIRKVINTEGGKGAGKNVEQVFFTSFVMQ